MKIRTNVKAGQLVNNHNQTLSRGLEVRPNRRLSSNLAWMRRTLSFMAIALVALTVAKVSTISTRAQLDSGTHDILQNGIRVGEVYVQERDPGATQYVEHWVLYNSYVYPSKDQPELKTEIRVAQKSSYESEADFFARVPFGPGFRYVRAECTDTDRLPGR